MVALAGPIPGSRPGAVTGVRFAVAGVEGPW